MKRAQVHCLIESSTPASKISRICDYCSVTRALIRSGCDLYDAFNDPYLILLTVALALRNLRLESPCWEDPQESLVEWSTFLCSQGVKLSDTLLIENLFLPHIDSSNFEQIMQERTLTVFLLCMLKADASFREERCGWQALHVLLLNDWSSELSPHFINLAYILIHLGGADVSAPDYEGSTPTIYAFINGWEDEWEIVLDRCGIDYEELFIEEIDRLRKKQRLGGGESSAVDTEELVVKYPGPVTRRRPVAGDRLDD